MPRYYVKNPENKWNIFSSVADDLIFPEWLEFKELKNVIINETVMRKEIELDSLLTEYPQLNRMDYEECMKSIIVEEEEE